MKYAKAASVLIAWHIACVASLFFTLRLMGNSEKWPLLALALVEFSAAILLATKGNFLNRWIGKLATFVLLMLLLWISLPSLLLIVLAITGETL